MPAESGPSSEVVARSRYQCPSCGGESQWNPARQALVCPYCGTVSPAELASDGSLVKENDLAAALRAIPEAARGWERTSKAVRCQSCQAISVFPAERVAQRCDFCGSSALIPCEQTNAPIRPESLLPFKIPETAVRERIRDWYGSRWFAPNALKTRALTDTVRGLYIPYWTFDAQVHALWTAEAGYYYYESETYRDSNGRTQTRQVRRTRWVPAAGELDHFFDDELVTGSRGVAEKLLKKIEPFPTGELVPFDAGYLSGWVVEQYQIDLIAAAESARAAMMHKLERLCAAEVPGDTQRGLQVNPDWSAQTFKHILVPVWLLAYDYRSAKYQVVINGFTGTMAGEHPLSWIKITLAVLAVILVVLIVLLLTNGQTG
jgi:hypothetical protein